MLDPKIIREKTETVYESLEKRGFSFDMEKLLQIDEKRRKPRNRNSYARR